MERTLVNMIPLRMRPRATNSVQVLATLLFFTHTCSAHEVRWIVSTVKGTLLVRNTDKGAFTVATLGSEVRRGQTLRLPVGSRATLECTDNVHVVPVGNSGVPPCQEHVVLLPFQGDRIPYTRNSPRPLWLAAPRYSTVLSTTPTFTWTSPKKLTKVFIKLSSEDQDWIAEVPDMKSYVYPKEFPELEKGKAYRWAIVSDPDEKPMASDWVPFTVASDLTINALKDEGAKIRARKGTSIVKTIAYADLYSHFRVFHQAYNSLSSQPELLTLPSVRFRLARIAAEIRDTKTALKHLDIGLIEARRQRDLAIQGDILDLKGQILENIDWKAARASYNAAIYIRRNLADKDGLSRTTKRLHDLMVE